MTDENQCWPEATASGDLEKHTPTLASGPLPASPGTPGADGEGDSAGAAAWSLW